MTTHANLRRVLRNTAAPDGVVRLNVVRDALAAVEASQRASRRWADGARLVALALAGRAMGQPVQGIDLDMGVIWGDGADPGMIEYLNSPISPSFNWLAQAGKHPVLDRLLEAGRVEWSEAAHG